MSCFGPLSIDTAFPAFRQMGAQFHVSPGAMQQLVSVYLLSFALMSILHGPISDAVGRKRPIIVGALIYAAASVGCALAPSFAMLLVFRALQGMSAGAGMILGRAIVQDLFRGAEARRQMSMVQMIFGAAPAVAPVLGGAILALGPWRWIFWFLSLWGAFVAILVALRLPESHPVENRVPLRVGPVVEGLGAAMSNLRFQHLAVAMVLTFASQFLYIAGAAVFVRDRLGLGEQDFWVLFVPLIIGIIGGSLVQQRIAHRVRAERIVAVGLGIIVVTAVANVVLAWLPATSGRLPWAVLAPTGLAFGAQLVFPVFTVAMLDLFPHRRGAAASAQSFEQLLFNAALSGVIVPIVGGSVLSMSITALVLGGLGALLGALYLRRYPGAFTEPVEP